jgi:hypothetical protein
MSFDNSSSNPYAAPAPDYLPSKPIPGTGRPGLMTFYCITAIVLGALGAFNAILGIGGLVFASFLQKSMQGTPPPGLSQEFVDLQNEMNAELLGINDRFFFLLLSTQILLVVVAVGLLVGGIRALSMTRSGVGMLRTMFMVTSVYEVARLVVTIFHQMATAQVMQKYFGPLMEKAPQGGKGLPPGFGTMMTTAVSIGVGVGLCFTVGWTITKLVDYLSGWVYLNKPAVQAQLKE